MTEDEKRRQKGELLLDYQEAIDNAAALRDKVKSLISELEAVKLWLGKVANASQSGDFIGVSFYSSSHASHVNIFGDARYAKAMDFQKVKDMTEEMTAALKRIEELARRKRELGLK
jgi:hypothetical protein